MPAVHELTAEMLRSMYHTILLPRLIEEKMLILLRQGKLSKWFSGIGQEAIAVGSTGQSWTRPEVTAAGLLNEALTR